MSLKGAGSCGRLRVTRSRFTVYGFLFKGVFEGVF